MIKSTLNYDMFKKQEMNRNIVESNVIRIMDSIKARNLLEYRPIEVNESLEVIDGQHRLEACKRLKIAVFYIIKESMSMEDNVRLQTQQLNWKKEDYLDYFCKLGNDNYIKLKEFARKNNISVTAACNLFSKGAGGGGLIRQFKEGRFVFFSEKEFETSLVLERLHEFIAYVKTKTGQDVRYLSSIAFMRAFVYFQNTKTVDIDIFFKKLPYKLDCVRPCARIVDYMNMLRSIYNWKNPNPIDPIKSGFWSADE